MTIKAPPDDSYLSIEDPKSIYDVLDSHGTRLTSLKLDLDWTLYSESRCISSILNLTPDLQELEITSFTFEPFDPNNFLVGPFPKLRKLTLLLLNFYNSESVFGVEIDNRLLNYFKMAESRDTFPSLQTMALLDRDLRGAPLDSRIVPPSHKALHSRVSERAKKLRERGITLVDVDGEIMEPWAPRRSRFAGRYYEGLEDINSDPEDLTYPSDDDEAYHSGSSEYSSWESEPEDGVSEPDDGSYSDVGSDEMMEMFENAINVRVSIFIASRFSSELNDSHLGMRPRMVRMWIEAISESPSVTPCLYARHRHNIKFMIT